MLPRAGQVLVFYAPQMEGMAHHISKVSNTVQLCTVRYLKPAPRCCFWAISAAGLHAWQGAPAQGVLNVAPVLLTVTHVRPTVPTALLRSWVRDVRDEGFKILNIEEPWRVPGSICVFLASFDSTEDIYEQFAVISKLPRLGAKMLKVIMPCFPSLTLRSEGGERGKGIPGEIPLSRTIARLMSAIPNAKTGPTELVIFDIHHLQERFYFDDNTVPRLETSMLLLADRLDEIIEQQVRASLVTPSNHGSAASAAALPFPWDEASQEEVVRLGSLGQLTSEENKQLKRIKVARRKYGDKAPMVAFSDEKTAKRFGKNFQGFQQIICTRMLKKEGQGRLMLLEGDPR